jgi:hypothetical protein
MLVAALGRQPHRILRAAGLTFDVAGARTLIAGVMRDIATEPEEPVPQRAAAGLTAVLGDLDADAAAMTIDEVAKHITKTSVCSQVTLAREVVQALAARLPAGAAAPKLRDSVGVLDGSRRCNTVFAGMASRVTDALAAPSTDRSRELLEGLLPTLVEAPDSAVLWLDYEIEPARPTGSACCHAITTTIRDLSAHLTSRDARALFEKIVDVTDLHNAFQQQPYAMDVLRSAKVTLAARFSADDIVTTINRLLNSGDEPFGSRSEELAIALPERIRGLAADRSAKVAARVATLLTSEHQHPISDAMYEALGGALATAGATLVSLGQSDFDRWILEHINASDGAARLAFIVSLRDRPLDRATALTLIDRLAEESALSDIAPNPALLENALEVLSRNIDVAAVTPSVRKVLEARLRAGDIMTINTWLERFPTVMTVGESRVAIQLLAELESDAQKDGMRLPRIGVGFLAAKLPDQPERPDRLEQRFRHAEEIRTVFHTVARGVSSDLAPAARDALRGAMAATRSTEVLPGLAAVFLAIPGTLTTAQAEGVLTHLREALAWSRDDVEAMRAATMIIRVVRAVVSDAPDVRDVLDYPTVTGPVAAFLRQELRSDNTPAPVDTGATGRRTGCPKPRAQEFKCPPGT